MLRVVIKTLVVCSVIYYCGLFAFNKLVSTNMNYQAAQITQELAEQCKADNATYCD